MKNQKNMKKKLWYIFKNTEEKKNYYLKLTTMDIAGIKFRFPSIEYALNEKAAEELQKIH